MVPGPNKNGARPHFFLSLSKLLFWMSSDKRGQATFIYKNGKMENFSIFLDVCFFVAGN